MTVSNGSTGRSGSGQVPSGSTPHSQSNGTSNGRGGGRDELTTARTAAGRGAGGYEASARPGS